MSEKPLAVLWRRVKLFKNWYWFIPPVSRVWTKNKVARLRNGAKILLRDTGSSDWHILMEIAERNIYRLENIKDPHVIFDIGANIGIFSVIAGVMFPDATIYAFEPQADNFEILKTNIELNRLSNVLAHNVAIGASEGELTLYLDESNHGTHTTIQGEWSDNARKEVVKSLPLSAFPKADVMKVDCEGAEFEILAENIPDCNYVVIEVHDWAGDKDILLKRFAEKYNVEKGEHGTFYFTPKLGRRRGS